MNNVEVITSTKILQDLENRLKLANKTIEIYVSKFERPELICPELVEYLENL